MSDLGLPKAIYLIIGAEFCERFSFCGIRTILSLYLRNNLLFDENTSTVIYHVFIMLCYIVPLIGAILADSFLGRYKTILYFSVVYTAGNVLLCLAAIPPIALPPVACSLVGLLLVAVGSGGIKPCVAAFGGDQFHLPQEEELLDKFFSYFYFSINFGGFIGMIFTPILRKSFVCFGDDHCYAIGFGFPALLIILSLYLYVGGKRLFRIRCPKENVILKFICCTCYAVRRRLDSKDHYADHWLDTAIEKYSAKLIDDMKIVFGILFLFIPVPLFWSLFDQQGSRWTFQATRMRGDFLGMHLIPDQMQVLNPAIVLVLIPLFDRSIYPVMGNNNTVTSLLTKMFAGGIIASFAFITSGALEIKLEETYPVLPEKDCIHLNFINTVPCEIEIVNPFNGLQIVNGSSNFVFKNINIKNTTSYDFMVFAPPECSDSLINEQQIYLNMVLSQHQVEEVIICAVNSQLRAFVTEFEDLNKTLSGKSKIRYSSEYMDLQYHMIKGRQLEDVTLKTARAGRHAEVEDEASSKECDEGGRAVALRAKSRCEAASDRITYIRGNNVPPNSAVEMEGSAGIQDLHFTHGETFSTSEFTELEPGKYTYCLSIDDHVISATCSEVLLHPGGVYILILQQEGYSLVFSKLFIITLPNTLSMLWLIPQYILISIAEVLFAIPGLEFSFLQAPKSLRTITIAAWYLCVAVGNLIVILVTQARFFRSQAGEFFLFAGLLLGDMVVFYFMARSYKFVLLEGDGSSTMEDDRLFIRASEELVK